MRICPICKAEYQDDIEFCFKDGSPLEVVEEEGGAEAEEPAIGEATGEQPAATTSAEFLPPEARALVSGELDPDQLQPPEPDAAPAEPAAIDMPSPDDVAPLEPDADATVSGVTVVPGGLTSPLDDEDDVEANLGVDPFAVPLPGQPWPQTQEDLPPAPDPEAETATLAPEEVEPEPIPEPAPPTPEPEAPAEEPAAAEPEAPVEPLPQETPPEQEAASSAPVEDVPPVAEELEPDDAPPEPTPPAEAPLEVDEPAVEPDAADTGEQETGPEAAETESMERPPLPPEGEEEDAEAPESDSETEMVIEDDEEPSEESVGAAAAATAPATADAFQDPMYETSIPPDEKKKKSGVMMWVFIGAAALIVLGLGGYLVLPGMLANGGGDGAADGGTESPTADGGTADAGGTEPATPIEPTTPVEPVTDEEITDEEITDEEITEEEITEDETPTEEETPTEDDGVVEAETPTPEPETPTPADAGGLAGKVTISSNPMGASFTVDGAPKGSTPLTVDLPYGSHTIRVEMDEYVAQEQLVNVQSASVFVDFTLQKSVQDVLGKLTVFTNPEPGATLFVDGVRKGKTPVTIDITRGQHQLRVELEGFPVQEETIDLSDLQPGETRRRVIALQ